MVAEADLVCQQSVPVLDVQYFPKGANIHEIGDAAAITPPSFDRVRASELVSAQLLSSQEVRFRAPFISSILFLFLGVMWKIIEDGFF